MREYNIQLTLPAPSMEAAKQVANEAQALIDRYGGETFLKACEFMKRNPQAVQMALNMIQR